MIEFTEEFNGYLRKYENIEIPDINAFNNLSGRRSLKQYIHIRMRKRGDLQSI